jgi:hypothetical protein
MQHCNRSNASPGRCPGLLRRITVGPANNETYGQSRHFDRAPLTSGLPRLSCPTYPFPLFAPRILSRLATIFDLLQISRAGAPKWRSGQTTTVDVLKATTWRRNGSWSLVEPRHCRQAARRIDRGRYPARRIHRVQGHSSAQGSHEQNGADK